MKRTRFWVIIAIAILFISINSQAIKLDYDTKKLSNGIKVVYKAIPNAKTVITRIVVPVGFLMEPRELRGISHLIEHLIYRGNEKYPAAEFRRRIDDLGGTYNGFTTMNRTEFLMEVPAEGLIPALEVYLDLILHPGLSEENIDLEKKIVSVEKELREKPGDTAFLYLNELTQQLFDSSVQSISRESIINYHQQFYFPKNLTIIMTGAFKPTEITKFLSNVADPNDSPTASAAIKFLFPEKATDIELEDYLTGEQYQILFGYELKQLSGKSLVVAKILPSLIRYTSRNFDYLQNKPLDYEIYLINIADGFYLIFSYRDCQDKFSPAMNNWHKKNLERYFKYLKAKKFDQFLDQFSKYLEVNFKVLGSDSHYLNGFYDQMFFEPATIGINDLAAIRGLSSGDFKDFVQKYLEGKSFHKVVVKAL